MTSIFKIVQRNRSLVSVVIPLTIIVFLYSLTRSAVFQVNPSFLSLVITLDLLVIVPGIYYLLIRDTRIPKTTVLPILILCFIAGTYALPAEQQYYLQLFKTWILPVVEIVVVTYIIVKVRSAVREYKKSKRLHPDFFTAVKGTCAEIFPEKVVPFIATEIAVFYYAFLKWKKYTPAENEFTYHKKNGTSVFLGAIIFIILIETLVVHLLLNQWNVVVAWVLTGLSLYTCFQFFGFVKSFGQRPISVQDNELLLRYGIIAETSIDIQDIEKIHLYNRNAKLDDSIRRLSPFGNLETCNVMLELKKEYVLTGIYGTKKKFTRLGLFVDLKDQFKQAIEQRLKQDTNL